MIARHRVGHQIESVFKMRCLSKKLAPRTVIYPMEASEFMDPVKTGHRDMLQPDFQQIGASVVQMCDIRASRAGFNLCNHEALKVDPLVGKWIRLA
jgi:hypothetical protein